MLKDQILSPEEKQLKKKRIEENRRLHFTSIDNNMKHESAIKPTTTVDQSHKSV